MPAMDVLHRGPLRQPITGEFADGRQHRETRLLDGPGHSAQEALFAQRYEPIEHLFAEIFRRTADRFRFDEARRAREDTEALEQRALPRPKQLVAPGDGVVQ